LRVLVLIADVQRGLGFMAATNPDSLSLRTPLEEWFDRYQYTVTSNIGESAVTSISLSDIPVSVEDVWQLPLCYGHHQGRLSCVKRSRPATPASPPTTSSSPPVRVRPSCCWQPSSLRAAPPAP
jgi:hypothetical protein